MPPLRPYTPEEILAIRKIVGSREKSIRNVLVGKELRINSSHASKFTQAILGACQEARMAVAAAKADATALAKEGATMAMAPGIEAAKSAARVDEIKQMLIDLLFESAPVQEIAELIGASGLDTVAETMADIIPYAGLAKNYMQFLAEAGKTVNKSIQLLKLEMSKSKFRDGDPKAAVSAIEKYVALELGFAAISTVEEYAVYAGKGACILVDFGTLTSMAIGAGNSALKIIKTLIWTAIEFRWFWQGRKALRKANADYDDRKEIKRLYGGRGLNASEGFTVELFEKCPILACYYLTLATHSDLAAFTIQDITASGEGPACYIDLDAHKKSFSLAYWLEMHQLHPMHLRSWGFANHVERNISGMLGTRKKAATLIGQARFYLAVTAKTLEKRVLDDLEHHPMRNMHRAIFDTLTHADRVTLPVRPGSTLTGSIFHAGRATIKPNTEGFGADGKRHEPADPYIYTPGVFDVPSFGHFDSGLSTLTAGQVQSKAKSAFIKFIGKNTEIVANKADELFAIFVLHRLAKQKWKMAREFVRAEEEGASAAAAAAAAGT